MTVTWDFGDGTTLTESRDVPVTHTFAAPGKHTVTADVGDQLLDKTVRVTARHRNLLLSDNQASAEDGTDGWGSSFLNDGSMESSTEQAYHGQRSIKVITASNYGFTEVTPTGADTLMLGDVAGRQFTFMAAVYRVTRGVMRTSISSRRSAGSQISFDQEAISPIVTDRWSLVRRVLTAPAETFGFQWSVGSAGVMNLSFYVDRVGIFEGDVAWDDWSLPSEAA